VSRSQEQFDANDAQRLENLANLASGELGYSTTVSESPPTIAPSRFDRRLVEQNSDVFPSLRTLVALSSRMDSLLTFLESEIAGSQRKTRV
jgi:hypothetical protein